MCPLGYPLPCYSSGCLISSVLSPKTQLFRAQLPMVSLKHGHLVPWAISRHRKFGESSWKKWRKLKVTLCWRCSFVFELLRPKKGLIHCYEEAQRTWQWGNEAALCASFLLQRPKCQAMSRAESSSPMLCQAVLLHHCQCLAHGWSCLSKKHQKNTRHYASRSMWCQELIDHLGLMSKKQSP